MNDPPDPKRTYHVSLPVDAAEILARLSAGTSPSAIVALALRQLDAALRPVRSEAA